MLGASCWVRAYVNEQFVSLGKGVDGQKMVAFYGGSSSLCIRVRIMLLLFEAVYDIVV